MFSLFKERFFVPSKNRETKPKILNFFQVVSQYGFNFALLKTLLASQVTNKRISLEVVHSHLEIEYQRRFGESLDNQLRNLIIWQLFRLAFLDQKKQNYQDLCNPALNLSKSERTFLHFFEQSTDHNLINFFLYLILIFITKDIPHIEKQFFSKNQMSGAEKKLRQSLDISEERTLLDRIVLGVFQAAVFEFAQISQPVQKKLPQRATHQSSSPIVVKSQNQTTPNSRKPIHFSAGSAVIGMRTKNSQISSSPPSADIFTKAKLLDR